MAKITDMPVEIVQKICYELFSSNQPGTLEDEGTVALISLARICSSFHGVITGMRLVVYDPMDWSGPTAYHYDIALGHEYYLFKSVVCDAALREYTTHNARGRRFWYDEEALIEAEMIFDRVDWAKFARDEKTNAWNESFVCQYCTSGGTLYPIPEQEEREEELRKRERARGAKTSTRGIEVILRRGP